MRSLHLAALAALAIPLTLSTGCASFNEGSLNATYSDAEHWSTTVTGASADLGDEVALNLNRVSVSRAGDGYGTGVDITIDKGDLVANALAEVTVNDIGGDARVRVAVTPDPTVDEAGAVTYGRAVIIDSDASWASGVADELDGGLMELGTCAGTGKSLDPTQVCVRFEAGTMGGQDQLCASYGSGLNLCFPLPSSWRGGGDGAGEQGVADEPSTEGAPADGRYPEPSAPLIEATALDTVTPTYPSRAPALPRTLADAGDAG